MTVLVIAILVVSVLNTVLMIGIAGSLSKLIRYMTGEDDLLRIMHERRQHQYHDRQLTYADAVLIERSPIEDDQARNWDGIPRGPNWDGIPRPRE